jgi:hypothetical protein
MEGAVKKTKKHIPVPKKGLHNWPPSRGPQPTQWTKKPKYVIPLLHIELIDYASTGRGPAKPIERVVPKMPKPKGTRVRGMINMVDVRTRFDATREISLYLSQSVSECATLKPNQWELIGGAKLVVKPKMSKKMSERYRRHRRTFPYASLETYLPCRTLTFDLDYPLSKIARVTIKPYTCISGYSGKHARMDLGYVLWSLAKAYKAIYKFHKKYGIWGHAITDLCFERITISDNIGDVSIGS